ncbi:uncharacterized protein si:ch211-227n13.3 isoform X2 [Puntigrus tetrazona]|uniref:uncharacterized protein si:ch211-227n13.3 isoform X2 n=1 Tax=Puntigrus tetrazona TaxID=1606681 RepID=UPI001C8A2766|nr:uncharacterized protein si:ch211-227n13.3 isoform X2 [Puntigrus tetrazona]
MENYHYLTNFPSRQESGYNSEVNILVLKEVTTQTVSMKLRRSTDLRGRRLRRREREKDSGIVSVVLSDTDCSQSDGVEEMKDPGPVARDVKRPVRKRGAVKKVDERMLSVAEPERGTIRKRKEDERTLSVEEPEDGRIQKICLAPGAMAEDTLEKLRFRADTSEAKLESQGELESSLDESGTDFTVESGPSSPCRPVHTVRCRECERLFAKMRKEPSLKKKSRDADPASLSCDVWVLLKKWHPQRRRHREKGSLWASLSRVRKLLAGASNSAFINKTEASCSRPHVFQQRTLRRCKHLLSIQTSLSITKAKPRHRKRSRSVVWPPVAGWNSLMKRRASLNNTSSQQLSPLNLSVSVRQEDKPLVDDSRLNADLKRSPGASSERRTTNVRGKLSKQEVLDGLDGTRRVLKFEDVPETVAVETAERRKSPRLKHRRREVREAHDGFQDEQQEGIPEDSDGFRTPTDLFSVKPKIKRSNQKKISASGVTKPAVQKPSFTTMLAALVKNQNRIIKESCK